MISKKPSKLFLESVLKLLSPRLNLVLTRFKPSIYRVNIWGHFNPTTINRVNNAISNTYRLPYKCHTFLETSWWWWQQLFLSQEWSHSLPGHKSEHQEWSYQLWPLQEANWQMSIFASSVMPSSSLPWQHSFQFGFTNCKNLHRHEWKRHEITGIKRYAPCQELQK